MIPYFILLFIITSINSIALDNSAPCDGFQANFNLKDVVGTWNVVAIIPEKNFPEKQITCYKVDVSETDEAGLRWLINKTVPSPTSVLPNDSNTVIIRQRYHSESPFDVWSKALHGANGCFKQVLSLDVGKKGNDKALKHDAMMQLHLLQVENAEPFLMQILWGRMIAVVIYRRKPGVTHDDLKPVFELMSKLRGPPRLPKICDSPLQDILLF